MMNEIIENRFVNNLTRHFRRSPLQRNEVHDSDAEIVRISANSDDCLAITTDTVAEEIAAGLYTDPYLIGWMTVMVNLSDLAAVAARPLGIVISQVLPANFPEASLDRLQKGIQDACEASNTFVLGGDTNFADQMMLTGCAIGQVNVGRLLSRRGCRPGDILYATNLIGAGNAFVLSKFVSSLSRKFAFQPVARLAEAQCLCNCATACMDTSDGVLATLDQLMRLNEVGFQLDTTWENALLFEAASVADLAGIPRWLLLAGHHGEFELLFTIPKEREEELHTAREKSGWNPLRLGEVIEEPSILLPLYGTVVSIDTASIRNVAGQTNLDIDSHIRQLMNIDHTIQQGAMNHVSQ